MNKHITIGVLYLNTAITLPTQLGSFECVWEVFNSTDDIRTITKIDALVVNVSKTLPNESLSIPTKLNSFFWNLENLRDPQNQPEFLEKILQHNSINFRFYDYFEETPLPTKFGDFILFGFRSRISSMNVLGLRTKNMPSTPVVRTHSMCYTGDIFHSLKCDCKEELENALILIQEKGGMLIYPEEEGRGIGILNKINVYRHQHRGLDTVDAQYAEDFPNDLRDYSYLRDIFRHYGLKNIKLITNNPKKSEACFKAGVHVSEIVKLPVSVNKHNRNYLQTKMDKNGHDFKSELG